MSNAVFVHTDIGFLERIKKESAGKALTTTSMLEALKWIANPINHLSAVFLNPDGPSFSGLQFIQLAQSHRPAMPVYLLEGKLAMNKSGTDRLRVNTNIKGVFSGTESYAAMTAALKDNITPTQNAPRTAPIKPPNPGYVSVPVSDFFTGENFPFNVFMASDEGDVRLFAPKDSKIDPEYLTQLAKKTNFLLAKEEDILLVKSKLEEIKTTVASNPDIPKPWQTSEVLFSAKGLIEELKKAGVADTMVAHTQKMLGDLYSLISGLDSEDEDEEGNLFDIIDRAKKCDRAVFCASYSILLCKQMRYERTATLEILGFASILQDVALYQTPFGDLSEKPPSAMTPEENLYYQKHPVLSSDLVAQHTDLPQVTLQVIRQAHERKNKTGFPNKIGGSQLHAMAEMLSLINTYYEISKENKSQTEVVDHMNRNVFPNYTENIVISFKQVLGSILKDQQK